MSFSSGNNNLSGDADVALNNPANNDVLTYNTSTAKWTNKVATGASNATTSAVGLIQLAGDLGGTATSPTVTGLSAKAPLASPAFTGTPTAPTATTGDSSTKIATTAFVIANAGSGGSGITQTTADARYVAKSSILINVKDYGATGNGSTDDTSSITSAVAALPSGGCLFFPTGTYVTSSAISITVPCYIEGEGGGVTTGSPQADVGVVLVNGTSGAGIFTCSADSVHFRRLFFTSYGGATAATSSQCCAITFTNGSGQSVKDCVFTGWYKGLWFKNCAAWVVRDNSFDLMAKYCVHILNAANPDNGDSVMDGNVFCSSSPWNSDALVRQESSGGLKVTANKFLNTGSDGTGPAIGFDMAIADGANTSILIFSANSFERVKTSSIRVTHGGTSYSGSFAKVIITGNQFSGGATAGPLIDIHGLSSSITLQQFIITGNLLDGNGTYPNKFISVIKASLVTIAANQFLYAPMGVYIDSTASAVAVSNSNTFFSVTTAISGTNYSTG